MSDVTKEDFLDWKTNEVTKSFYEACKERVEDTEKILGKTAGLDSVNDNFYRGFIAAYMEMFDFRPEDE